MALSQSLVLRGILFICLAGALGIDEYVPQLPFLEGAALLTILTFVWLSLTVPLGIGTWAKVVAMPTVLIAGVMVTYATVFSLNTGAPTLPSLLALRFFLFFLLAPLVYLCFLAGVTLRQIKEVLFAALMVAALIYVVAFLVLPLEEYARSADPEKRRLVTLDAWRGVRLKSPVFIFVLLLAYNLRRMFLKEHIQALPMVLFVLVIVGSIFLLNVPRMHLAALLASCLGYFLFFAGRYRLRATLFITPFVIGGLVSISGLVLDLLVEFFSGDASLVARYHSIQIAIRVFLENPLLGQGQASYHSVSFQQLYGIGFFPSDIGIIGTLFRFGIVGVVLYLAWGIGLLSGLLGVHLSDYVNKRDPAVWALLFTLLAMFVASLIQPILIDKEGIPITAFMCGIIMIYRHQFRALDARRQLASRHVASNRLRQSRQGRNPAMTPGRHR